MKLAPSLPLFDRFVIIENRRAALKLDRRRNRVDIDRGKAPSWRGQHGAKICAADATNEEIGSAKSEPIALEVGLIADMKGNVAGGVRRSPSAMTPPC
jgi:hypothetical protein